ncbi:transglutaminase domain protein [Desulfonatronospira thiodismutans ASO3-1]|uniref:Transglutaminase domain protein n=1 Tax=Desulfonatronospira thiodismutans ASO3-1 TaxID=555779 RepID=D6SMB3_9BACT|nr:MULTISPECIES: transglutaminase family protein [Desulfonatronospira]EFI35824.1 transglutaminase domain protein [Desulfonatronospira thiodismutans ASO3-1]RQD78964.1 MAG: transglutaminase family protein [Desulfonatronospira sp. MSAO_Bac3]
MIYSITNTTVYHFNRGVFFEPHYLRLYPRNDPGQKVLKHSISIDPLPTGYSTGLDVWGNSFVLAWFEGFHSIMQIKSTSKVQTLRTNPFDFVLPGSSQGIPPGLNHQEKTDLKSCLTPRFSRLDNFFSWFDPDTCKRDENHVVSLLSQLTNWIFEHVKLEQRWDTGIIPPSRLLETRQGCCRDLSALFVEFCRQLGIASRFVSGYQEGDEDILEAELHAWAEVYLPGAGWRGYDPSHGLAVADRHVALAAAPDLENIMPVVGTYRGNEARSSMEHSVHMKRLR